MPSKGTDNKFDLSIITVVKDDEENLEKTKQSITEQTEILGLNVEHIIVEASNQGSLGEWKLKKYNEKHIKVRCYRLNDNGIYMAMNFGIAKAKGEYCLFLNAGDLYYSKNAHIIIHNAIHNYPDCDAIHFLFEYKRGATYSPHHNLIGYTDIKKAIQAGGLICQQSILFKRRGLIKIGGFDQYYKLAGDYELLCRMLAINSRITTEEQVLVTYMGGGLSETRQNECAHEIIIIRENYIKLFL